MNSKLLDSKTLAAVIAASPTIEEDQLTIARKLVERLKELSTPYNKLPGGYMEHLGKIAPIFQTSSQQVGRIVRELGLTTMRTRDGYAVVWNGEQIQILDAALGQQ